MEKITVDIETKYIVTPFEIESTKEAEVDGQKFGIVKGYGATTGNIDNGFDRIMKGAFKETLANYEAMGKQIPMRYQHGQTIGGWPVFKENRKGLYVEGNINLGVQSGMDAYLLAKQGVVDSMSIGYRATDSEWVNEKVAEIDGVDITKYIRNIKKLKLFEVSVLDIPMNDQAVISSVKSCESITDISKLLKSKGLSNKEANEIIYFIKSLVRNDTDPSEEMKARNEIFRRVDSIATVNYLDQIITKIKGSI